MAQRYVATEVPEAEAEGGSSNTQNIKNDERSSCTTRVKDTGEADTENVAVKNPNKDENDTLGNSKNDEYISGSISVTYKGKDDSKNVVVANQHKDEKNSTIQKQDESPSEDAVDLSGCGCWSNTAGCDPRRGSYRLTGLFLICFLEFGFIYCADVPGALQDQIIKSMEINTTLFATLISLSAWPNVVLCFVGGFLIDRVFGVRLGTIIFSMLVVVGQVVFALGAYTGHFWCMGCGMFIFGTGGDILSVVVNIYIVRWFKGNELSTVFGIQLSIVNIGSTISFLTLGPLYAWADTFSDGYKTLGITLLIVNLTCVTSLGFAFILGLLDKRRSRVLKLHSADAGEKIELKDIFTFKTSFWLLSLICVTFYVSKMPFIGLSKMTSIQNLGLALMTLLAGYIVDTKGYLFTEIFYMIWLCVALASTMVMWLVDVKDDYGYLSMSPNQREAFIEAKKKVYSNGETKKNRPLSEKEK